MSTLPDYPAALRQALAGVAALDRTENVPLAGACGRVLAQPIIADRDLPPFHRAQMDGYALRASEVGQVESWPVAATIAAGDPANVPVPPGACVAIATGAPLPEDVDTVIQHELSDRNDPVRFTIDSIEPGHAVHPRGSDAKTGATLVAPRVVLAPHHLGIAASIGAAHLAVATPPRATIVTSGDEVRPVESHVEPHQIRNSNATMLTALLPRFGATVVGHHHIADDRAVTIERIGEALEGTNLVVTVGGISAGARDFLPDAFEAHGVSYAVRGAAIQPGRPIIIGRTPHDHLVAGLPGNPVSALACACLFVWPLVRARLGLPPDLPWRRVELAEPVKPNPRRQAFRPARLEPGGRAIVPKWAGSGDLAHTATTDGLLELPVQEEAVAAGTTLRLLPWP